MSRFWKLIVLGVLGLDVLAVFWIGQTLLTIAHLCTDR